MADSYFSRVVWPNYDASNVRQAASRQPTDTLGKDQFLSILVAQLRNQDPMQPMQDRDFIAQMAQFTSVEQLMNMSGELALMRQSIGSASSLIGKHIQWFEYNNAGDVVAKSGIVDSILSKNGVLYAKTEDTEIALDYVTTISDRPIDEPAEPEQPGTEEPEQPETETPEAGSGEEAETP